MDKIVASQTASHLPEKLEFFAKALKGEIPYKVFLAISNGHLKPKFVSDLEASTGLSNVRISQVAAHLANLGLIDRGRGKNSKTGKIENFYSKRRDVDALKSKFLRLRNNPAALSRIPTMRRPQVAATEIVSFIKHTKRPSRRKTLISRRNASADLRVAFLGTNPVSASPLRTDIESRTLARALKATTNRDKIDVRYFPAAEWSDLLEALNEFRPHIVHFSGHGGGQGVIFDNENLYDNGGVEIDYKLLNMFIGSSIDKPDLLVLNACDTLDGADVFLESVKAVISMSDSIDDAAATYFSRFMYLALAEGQPISNAVLQGKLALSAMKLPDADLPNLLHRKNVDPASIKYF
jgi:hypothetical protein